MSIKKRPTGWQVNVRGFPRQTVPTHADATRIELDLKRRKSLGEYYQAASATLGQTLDAYLARRVALGSRRTGRPLSEGTRKADRASRGHWEPLNDTPLNRLHRVDVETLVISIASDGPVAAQGALKQLRACLRDAISRGQQVDPRVFDVPMPAAKPAGEKKILSRSEEDRLVARLPVYMRLAVIFTAMVGLRWGEVFRMTDDMVDLRAKTVDLPAWLVKERKRKLIDLTDAEVSLLREQLMARSAGTRFVFPTASPGGMLHHSPFVEQWEKARNEAGMPGFLFHELRHTAISRMAENGMPAEVIARRVGHSDGGALIFKRYRHLYDHEMRRALDRLGESQATPVQTDTNEAAG